MTQATQSESSATASGHGAGAQGSAALALGALGVVYGDIGTSPLYTMKEIFGPGGVPVNEAGVLGAVSTLLWAIMVIVTLKYVLIVLRADNRGEGGVTSMLALALGALKRGGARREVLLLLGAAGAALFYGNAVITPSLSVLGAVEGLDLVTPAFAPYVMPIAVVILLLLFLVQYRGTESVGRVFGPVMLGWFLVLGVVGILHIADAPRILAALNPLYAAQFLVERGAGLLIALAAIVLAVTGAEALYADMGHFGARAIRFAWGFVVLPCLALNYLGQGAMLLANPAAADLPFYRLFPEVLVIPAVVLGTAAAIIASQAVITGAYSITQQVIRLGFLPRMRVVHTSHEQRGQIYIPLVNGLLMVGVIAAAIAFGSSTALAGAYGIAVTVGMFIDTLLLACVAYLHWRLPRPLVFAGLALFGVIDLLLVAACATKVIDGGWLTIAIAATILLLVMIWRAGRRQTAAQFGDDGLPLATLIESMAVEPLPRAPRTAVFLMSADEQVPKALLHNLKHNVILHERNVLLTVDFQDVPQVADEERIRVEALGHEFYRLTLAFGYMEIPNVPAQLERCAAHGLAFDLFETSFFINRQSIVPSALSGSANWRQSLFALMYRNASNVANYFHIPHNSVIEVGIRVAI